MSKVKYLYDFPENRDIGKELINGDKVRIAKATGYSKSYINLIFDGLRKMPESVKETAKIIIDINRSKNIALVIDE